MMEANWVITLDQNFNKQGVKLLESFQRLHVSLGALTRNELQENIFDDISKNAVIP